MIIKKILLFIFLLFTTLSCSIQIRGVFSNYENVLVSNPNLIKTTDNQAIACSMDYTDSSKVLILNGKELQNCIKDQNKTVIYLWDGNCKGDYCYGLDRVDVYLRERNRVIRCNGIL